MARMSRLVPPKKRDAAIVIVVHENGQLYLAPKPGGEHAWVGFKLYFIVVNLTASNADVVISFGAPAGPPLLVQQTVSHVKPGKMKHKVAVVPNVFQGLPSWVTNITVSYTITVNGTRVDPELEIER